MSKELIAMLKECENYFAEVPEAWPKALEGKFAISDAITALERRQWTPDWEICAGCSVQEPWEHKCHGLPCACQECQRAVIWVSDWEPGFIGDGVPTHEMSGVACDAEGTMEGEVAYVRRDLALPPLPESGE